MVLPLGVLGFVEMVGDLYIPVLEPGLFITVLVCFLWIIVVFSGDEKFWFGLGYLTGLGMFRCYNAPVEPEEVNLF